MIEFTAGRGKEVLERLLQRRHWKGSHGDREGQSVQEF